MPHMDPNFSDSDSVAVIQITLYLVLFVSSVCWYIASIRTTRASFPACGLLGWNLYDLLIGSALNSIVVDLKL
jgi:hypothetical protein